MFALVAAVPIVITQPSRTLPEQDRAGRVLDNASIGDARGAVLFDTEPLFRDHLKDLYSQVANAPY